MQSRKAYQTTLKKLLSPAERHLLGSLRSPQYIQDYLDRLPANFAETHHSPRKMILAGKAQCIEGALFAAAALAYHGRLPLLLDLRTVKKDDDHVVALFHERGRWGALSKTNHPVLRFRDPVYHSVQELALSYFHEYFLNNGMKTLRAYSAPFDLRAFPPERWVTAEEPLWWLAEALDRSRHFTIAPRGMRPGELRRASPIERAATAAVEWERRGRRHRY